MSELGSSRWQSTDAARGDAYDEKWRQMAAAGQDPHGEVAFVQRFEPTRVLDAGCGTGRVAIELDRRGVDVVGFDLDLSMLDSLFSSPIADMAHQNSKEFLHSSVSSEEILVAKVGSCLERDWVYRVGLVFVRASFPKSQRLLIPLSHKSERSA